jgi:hypothetical protein
MTVIVVPEEVYSRVEDFFFPNREKFHISGDNKFSPFFRCKRFTVFCQ